MHDGSVHSARLTGIFWPMTHSPTEARGFRGLPVLTSLVPRRVLVGGSALQTAAPRHRHNQLSSHFLPLAGTARIQPYVSLPRLRRSPPRPRTFNSHDIRFTTIPVRPLPTAIRRASDSDTLNPPTTRTIAQHVLGGYATPRCLTAPGHMLTCPAGFKKNVNRATTQVMMKTGASNHCPELRYAPTSRRWYLAWLEQVMTIPQTTGIMKSKRGMRPRMDTTGRDYKC
jgi:hypothetical protein